MKVAGIFIFLFLNEFGWVTVPGPPKIEYAKNNGNHFHIKGGH